MGGKTAMTLALAQPERIDQLVVIGIAPCTKESIMGESSVSLQDLLNIELNQLETKEELDEKIKELSMVCIYFNACGPFMQVCTLKIGTFRMPHPVIVCLHMLHTYSNSFSLQLASLYHRKYFT